MLEMHRSYCAVKANFDLVACQLFRSLENKPSRETVMSIVKEAVEVEKSFICGVSGGVGGQRQSSPRGHHAVPKPKDKVSSVLSRRRAPNTRRWRCLT